MLPGAYEDTFRGRTTMSKATQLVWSLRVTLERACMECTCGHELLRSQPFEFRGLIPLPGSQREPWRNFQVALALRVRPISKLRFSRKKYCM